MSEIPFRTCSTSPRLRKGSFTITIDLELGWGWRGIGISPREKELILEEEQIVRRLLALFRRHNIKVTWAVVGNILGDPRNRDSSRSELLGSSSSDAKLWHSQELVKSITRAEPRHDLASHSFSHVSYDTSTPRQYVLNDLTKAKSAHIRHDLPFRAFVFPWNRVGHLDLLAKQGIRIYRGEDDIWYDRLPRRLYRLGLFLDKMMPIAPRTVLPKKGVYNLISIHGCMALHGKYGIVTGRIAISKAKAGIDRAMKLKEAFHLWFHPAAFYYERSRQFQVLGEILSYSSKHVREGNICNLTLSEYLDGVRE